MARDTHTGTMPRRRVDPWKRAYMSPNWVGLEILQQRVKEAVIEANSRAEAKRRMDAALRNYEKAVLKEMREHGDA